MSEIPKFELEESDLLDLIFSKDYMYPDTLKDIADEIASKAQEFVATNYINGSPDKAKDLILKWSGLDNLEEVIEEKGEDFIEEIERSLNVKILENKS